MTEFIQTLALAAALTLGGIAAASAEPSPAGDPQEAEVRTLVSSIPIAVDRAAYDLAQAAFAPSVVIDYTSLWGGEASEMTPADLMTAWRGIVPGFDTTWHELGPVTVTLDGDGATATATVDARHWIGEKLWRPIGTYTWSLTRTDGEWAVTKMVFTLTDEIGDRDLVAQAMERAKQ